MNNSTLKTTVAASNSANVSSSPPFDPWILWVTFRRCWAWALPVGAVLAGITAVVILSTFVPTYRATHLLEANQDYVLTQGVNPVFNNLAQTESQIIMNPIVLDPVLANSRLRTAPSLSNPETAELNLRKNLHISNGGNGFRLEISYDDIDRESAAMVCNAIVDAYLAKRDAFDVQRVNNLEKWLEPEIARWEQEVENHQDKVNKLMKQTMGYSPTSKSSRLESDDSFSNASYLRSKITEIDLEILVLEEGLATENEGDLTNADSKSGVPELVVVAPEIRIQRRQLTESEIKEMVQSDAEVIKAKRLIEYYEARVRDLRDQLGVRTYRDEIKQYQKKMEDWSQALESAELAARVEIDQKLSEIVEENYQRDLAMAKAADETAAEAFAIETERKRTTGVSDNRKRLEELKSERNVLNQQYRIARNELEQFGGATAELQFANEDLAVSTGLLQQLRSRVATIRTERRTDGAVRTIAPATTPRLPIEEIPYKKLIFACAIALFFPFLPGLLWEVRSLRFTDSSMCDKNGLSVIGEIARLPAGPRTKNGRRLFEESVETLRSSLFISTDTKDIRSIAIVSSISGEGKSSVSSQLALSIAKATGETVLLVDSDLRCPDQHDIFGLDIGPGLVAVLTGKMTLSNATDKSLGDLIHVLPAGRLTTSPHRLITRQSMQAFVKDALKEYSYVIIDTAPVLSAGESLAVAACVDAALMCVMRDVSRVDNSTRAMRRLEAAGANLAGTVFSGVSASQYAYRYGNYHYGIHANAVNDSANAS